MPRKTATKPAKQPKSQLDPTGWLLAALPFAAESGWRPGILVRAAERLGCDPALSKVVFPGGIADLVRAFNSWANDQMLARMNTNSIRYMKVRQKIAAGVCARLEALAPHQEAVRQLLRWSAVPLNTPVATRCLYETVNLIWYEAGDKSTDYNFYTKRGLLAAVYSSTLLFWLNDTSRGHEATWAFLEARIDDVMQLGAKMGQLKQFGNLADKFMKMRRAA